MAKETVLVYGSPGHVALRLLYERMRLRGVRRTLYLLQEQFPAELGITLELGDSDEGSSLCLGSGEAQATLSELVAVAVDGYYIPGDPQLSPQDRQYAQIEGWAALVAVLHQLSSHCLVANHVAERDYFSCRWGELCLLGRHGLAVPRVMVTSDPEAARSFYHALEGKVLCKPVSGLDFRPVMEDDLGRFDRLRLSPIHFEEVPQGWIGRLIVLGEQVTVLPAGGPELPDSMRQTCLRLCRGLGLVLAEVSLRCHEGRWMATGLRRFLTPESLSEVEILDEACAVLEAGRREAS